MLLKMVVMDMLFLSLGCGNGFKGINLLVEMVMIL